MNPTQNKDLNQFLKPLIECGWQVDSKGRHIKMRHPAYHWLFVVVPKSPSDSRSVENLKAKFKRALRTKLKSCGEAS